MNNIISTILLLSAISITISICAMEQKSDDCPSWGIQTNGYHCTPRFYSKKDLEKMTLEQKEDAFINYVAAGHTAGCEWWIRNGLHPDTTTTKTPALAFAPTPAMVYLLQYHGATITPDVIHNANHHTASLLKELFAKQQKK